MQERSESLSLPAWVGRTDGQIAVLAQNGSRRAMEHLLEKYRPVVENTARDYFWAGADGDDVVQEGMIGLYKAIRDYSPLAQTRFRSFAKLCVHRQIVTGHAGNPERVVIGRDIWNSIHRFALQDLSQLEKHALLNYIVGERYQDIAAELGCNVKQIDNALQRAKRKIAGQFAPEATT